MASALLLGGAVLLPVLAAGATKAAAQPLFTAPAGKLTLTRELHRAMSRGQEVITRRSYAITIVPDGDGWRIDGALIDSQIESPPELAMLAELEKARSDDRLFPLYLDREGLIVQQNGSGDAASRDAARAIVNRVIAGTPLANGETELAANMVQQIGASSAALGGKWPADLFRPASGRRSESHTMPLPGGNEGKITVVIEAECSGDGLLDHFARHIVTELAGTRRENREVFTLARAR